MRLSLRLLNKRHTRRDAFGDFASFPLIGFQEVPGTSLLFTFPRSGRRGENTAYSTSVGECVTRAASKMMTGAV